MEQLSENTQVQSTAETFESDVGGNYILSDDDQSTLEEILKKLSLKDGTIHTFRKAVGFSEIIKKDLLPLLTNIKDRKIIGITIRILSNLTTPVECLLPVDVMLKTEAGKNTILELKWLLESCRESFLDPRTTRSIVNHIKDVSKNEILTASDVETLIDSLTLLRNILCIPVPKPASSASASNQNQILWNLFAQNLDKVVIDLISCNLKGEWRLMVVQLIALFYKDLHVPTLEKLLHQWCEASVLRGSSEDNESNTSPPERESGDSSSMNTSDPTSDSSDNGGTYRNNECENKGQKSSYNFNKKILNALRKQSIKFGNQQLKKQEQYYASTQNGDGSSKEKSEDMNLELANSETSDGGYGTQVENQESVSSTSSHGGDHHHSRCHKLVYHKLVSKVHKTRYSNGKQSISTQEREELKRKKIIRRTRSNVIHLKALQHHVPTDDDIAHLLKEFTVDFLLQGYGTLLSDLREQLLFNVYAQYFIDSSHFFWLITYFLKFAVLLELDIEHIRYVLTFDVVSFIIYEGVGLCEQYELAKVQSEFDLTTCLRKMHLVVTAIREIIQTINSYKKVKHLSNEAKMHLSKLQSQISESEDLRCLFVLLLRQFNPKIHCKQYLQDIVVTNHLLLTFIDNDCTPNTAAILQTHLQHFVSVDMMTQYGILLGEFEENGRFVNDCIFTMMHHVAGDLKHVTSLLQSNILKTFSKICEKGFELCDDWVDLVEYVIYKFIHSPPRVPLFSEKQDSTEICCPVSYAHSWSEDDCNSLYWYYVQCANNNDPVGAVIKLYSENGITNKTRIGVIEQLLKQDVITKNHYNELMMKEPISGNPSEDEYGEHTLGNRDDVELLKEQLIKDGKIESIKWLQKVLIEACNAKINLKKNRKEFLTGPVSYYSAMLQESTPIVAWSFEQCNMMHNHVFLVLMHKLGLHLPVYLGKYFARIPQSWTADVLYNVASKLGPVPQDWLKFSVEDINEEIILENFDVQSFNNETDRSSPCVSSAL